MADLRDGRLSYFKASFVGATLRLVSDVVSALGDRVQARCRGVFSLTNEVCSSTQFTAVPEAIRRRLYTKRGGKNSGIYMLSLRANAYR